MTKSRKKAPAPPQETVPELQAVHLPLSLLDAALNCVLPEKEAEHRPFLNGIYVHAVDGAVRVVSSDGARLFVGSATPTKEALPSWLEKGIVLPSANLKPRLKLIGAVNKHWQFARIAYAADAPKIEMRDTVGENVFRFAPLATDYVDYRKVIEQSAGSFEGGKYRDLDQIGYSPKYLKQVGTIAAALESESIVVYGRSTSDEKNPPPSVFSFADYAGGGAVLYLMPSRTAPTMTAGTAKLLAPAIAGTVAALRAHQTRHEKAAEQATSPAAKKAALARAAAFKERIAAIIARTGTIAALPAPDRPEPPAISEPAPASEPTPPEPPAAAVDAPKPEPVTPPSAPAQASPAPSENDEFTKDPAYQRWITRVNTETLRQSGVSVFDIDAIPNRLVVWFKSKVNPKDAASRAVLAAKNAAKLRKANGNKQRLKSPH